MEQGQANAKIAELEAELASALEYQRATSDILRVISSSSCELQPVLDVIVERAARLCKAEASFIWKLETDRLHVAAMHAIDANFAKFALENPPPLDRRTAAGRSVLDNSTVHITNVEEDPEYSWRGNQVSKIGSYRTALGVPLSRDGLAFGAIALLRNTVTPFSKEEINLVATFASQAVIAIENARLFEAEQERTRELSEALEYQTATAEVLSVISKSPDSVDPVFDSIITMAEQLCHADYGFVYRLGENDRYELVAAPRAPEEYVAYRKDHPIEPGDDSIMGRALLAGRAIHVADTKSDREQPETDAHRLVRIRSALGVPLMSGGKAIGVIGFVRSIPSAFTERHVKLVTTFADQAVIAIENARLFHETSEALEHQTATSDVLEVISRSPSELEPVFTEVLTTAKRLCEAEWGSVWLLREDCIELVAQIDMQPDFAAFLTQNPLPTEGQSATGLSIAQRKVLHLHDITAHPDYGSLPQANFGGVRTFLSVPLLHQGTPLGAIVLTRSQVRPFTEKQISIVRTFADQAVIAIENARLFQAEQERSAELQEALEYQSASAEVLGVISNSQGELEPIFQAMLTRAMDICEANFGSLFEFSNGGFQELSSRGVPPDYVAFCREWRVWAPDTGLGRLAETREPVHILDIRDAPAYKRGDPNGVASAEVGGIRTLLIVPMIKQAELLGAIAIFRQEVRAFSAKQIGLVANFADQAVLAIENARLFEAEKSRTAELSEALEYQTTTSEVLGVISRSPTDSQPVFDMIGKAAARLCDAEFSVIAMVDGDVIRLASVSGVDENGAQAINNAFPMGLEEETVTSRVVRSGSVVRVEDIHDFELYENKDVAETVAYRACLGVPMIRNEQVLGVLFVAGRRPGQFGNRQLKLLETFADQAVIAIENARLFDQTNDALEYQTATSKILSVVSESLGQVEKAFDVILESACELCEAEYGHLLLLENDAWTAAALRNVPPAYAEFWRAAPVRASPETLLGRIRQSGKPDQYADARLGDGYRSGSPLGIATIELGEARTLFGVPLLRDGGVIGAIVLYRKEVRPFSEREVSLLISFSSQAVIAIENARLLEELQTRQAELTETLEYQTATSEVLGVISRSPTELQPVLDAIAATAGRLCEAARSSILEFKDGQFLLVAHDGPEIAGGLKDHSATVPLAVDRGNLPGRAALERRTIHVHDIRSDAEYTFFADKEHDERRTMLCAPLMRKFSLIGVIVLSREEVRPFSERQI